MVGFKLLGHFTGYIVLLAIFFIPANTCPDVLALLKLCQHAISCTCIKCVEIAIMSSIDSYYRIESTDWLMLIADNWHNCQYNDFDRFCLQLVFSHQFLCYLECLILIYLTSKALELRAGSILEGVALLEKVQLLGLLGSA